MKLSVGGAESLLISWNRCWSGIGANGDGASLKNDLVTAWNEPQRKYHTLQHLHGCLSIFEEFQHLAEHPHEVELAIWFHDAVYDIKGKNNEQKSGQGLHLMKQASVKSVLRGFTTSSWLQNTVQWMS